MLIMLQPGSYGTWKHKDYIKGKTFFGGQHSWNCLEKSTLKLCINRCFVGIVKIMLHVHVLVETIII